MSGKSPLSLSKKDFASEQEVRWCPGCGDYAILTATQTAFAGLGVPREKFVIVSGIGCAARFPYYMNVYGFHTIHGRAPSVATGIKVSNPELSVWVVSGDGDALSIGGNHLIHLMRRNVGVKLMMFDNRIYGLTKGQYSPTSESGKRTKSTPYGSIDEPFVPAAVALGAGAGFIARSVDVFGPHLKATLTRAHEHAGAAFVQIFQNCNIFNHGTFDHFRDKDNRADNTLEVEHGKPLLFGAARDRGIRMTPDMRPEVVKLGNGITEADVLIHDERGPIAYTAMLCSLSPPEFPMPIGVLRAVVRPSFEAGMRGQLAQVTADRGKGDLRAALHAGHCWTVED